MKRRWIQLSLFFLLTSVFLYFFFRNTEWKEVFDYLSKVDVRLLILTIFFVPVHLATRAIRWNYLLQNKKKGIKFFNRFAANAVGFTVTYLFPGRLGELVKPLYLAQKENITKGFVLGTVVVERVFDIFTICFLLGLFLVLKPFHSSFIQINEEIYSNLYYWGIGGLVFAFIILFLSLFLYFLKEKALSIIAIFIKPIPKNISNKIIALFEEFIDGLKFFHSLKNLFMYILWSFIVWVGMITHTWIFFFAYRISVPLFSLVPYIFLTMVGAAIPTPGMVGGFHYFSKLGLVSLYRIDPNLAISMTIVIHMVHMIITCLVGFLILWKEGLHLIQIKKLGKNL